MKKEKQKHGFYKRYRKRLHSVTYDGSPVIELNKNSSYPSRGARLRQLSEDRWKEACHDYCINFRFIYLTKDKGEMWL